MQNCQIVHFVEILDQLYIQVSLELNVIKTNHFFLHKESDDV